MAQGLFLLNYGIKIVKNFSCNYTPMGYNVLILVFIVASRDKSDGYIILGPYNENDLQ